LLVAAALILLVPALALLVAALFLLLLVPFLHFYLIQSRRIVPSPVTKCFLV
jgi:hypothetical protein